MPTIALLVFRASDPWGGFAYNMGLANWFAATFEGYITIHTTGNYRFSIISDDGAYLELSDSSGRTRRIIDSPGAHPTTSVSGDIGLTAGVYTVRSETGMNEARRWRIDLDEVRCTTWFLSYL